MFPSPSCSSSRRLLWQGNNAKARIVGTQDRRVQPFSLGGPAIQWQSWCNNGNEDVSSVSCQIVWRCALCWMPSKGRGGSIWTVLQSRCDWLDALGVPFWKSPRDGTMPIIQQGRCEARGVASHIKAHMVRLPWYFCLRNSGAGFRVLDQARDTPLVDMLRQPNFWIDKWSYIN